MLFVWCSGSPRDLSRRQRQRLVTALSVAAQVRERTPRASPISPAAAADLQGAPSGPVRALSSPGGCFGGHGTYPDDYPGNACRNYNNHPFSGRTAQGAFALAHNGVLYNDRYLRGKLHLPETRIETDSYIAVQLIERQGALDLSSLRHMAEQVDGSFVFTLLDGAGRLYVVRGDNPFCLWYFPQHRCFAYASTEAILREGLRRSRLSLGAHDSIPAACGEILQIDAGGNVSPGTASTTAVCCFPASAACEKSLSPRTGRGSLSGRGEVRGPNLRLHAGGHRRPDPPGIFPGGDRGTVLLRRTVKEECSLKILLIAPMEPPAPREIDGTLASMQRLVGGSVQASIPLRRRWP